MNIIENYLAKKDINKHQFLKTGEIPYTGEFDLFKSNVCHAVKRTGEIKFMIGILESTIIRDYFRQKRYKESLYLLGMLDYLSRKNDIPLCTDFNDLRCYYFSKPIYPLSLLIRANIMKDEQIKIDAYKNAIPEFLHFNIVESAVENVY